MRPAGSTLVKASNDLSFSLSVISENKLFLQRDYFRLANDDFIEFFGVILLYYYYLGLYIYLIYN